MLFPDKKPSARAAIIDKKIRKELGAHLQGKPAYTSIDPLPIAVTDPRSRWQKFVQSTAQLPIEEHMQVEIPLPNERTLTLVVDIATSKTPPRYGVCSGLSMHMPITLPSPSELTFERKKKLFSGPSWAARLNADHGLCKRMQFLIQRGYHLGAVRIPRSSAGFFTPELDGVQNAAVTTVPQETWGGIILRLGVGEFVKLIERIEELARG